MVYIAIRYLPLSDPEFLVGSHMVSPRIWAQLLLAEHLYVMSLQTHDDWFVSLANLKIEEQGRTGRK